MGRDSSSSGITPELGEDGRPRVQASARPAPGDLLGDRFLLRRVLGVGASGTVFEATDTMLRQRVAVKILHPELVSKDSLARFEREVRLSRAPDPGAVTIFDIHHFDGIHLLSMELVEGESLRSVLEREQRLTQDTTIAVGLSIGQALEHLHDAGLVHRDVKPGNILVPEKGRARLCDMGLVRPLTSGETLTATASVLGTPVYMAPEYASGGELSPASDIYALGLTLWRCLTGEVPMLESTTFATLYRRQRGRTPSVRQCCPDCPRWLDRLIRKMLEANPVDRPSARQVVRALTAQRFAAKLRLRVVWKVAALLIGVVGAAAAIWAVLPERTVRMEVVGDQAPRRRICGLPTRQYCRSARPLVEPCARAQRRPESA